MSKHNTMTYKETVEELEFAIEHNLRFNKHDIERILPKEDIERIAKKVLSSCRVSSIIYERH